jgi:hypothetical protein
MKLVGFCKDPISLKCKDYSILNPIECKDLVTGACRNLSTNECR